MVKFAKLNQWVVEIKLESGDKIVFPLNHPDLWRVNPLPEELIHEMAELCENNLKNNMARDFIMEVTSSHVEVGKLNFHLGQSPQPFLYNGLSLDFDYLYWEISSNKLCGFVPLLGLFGIGKDIAELEEALLSNIKLEFFRKKRLESIPSLLFTQYVEEVKGIPVEVEFKFDFKKASAPEIDQRRHESEILASIATHKGASSSGRAFELEKELQELAQAFKKEFHQSILLVGPNGVGKSVLVEEFVQRKEEFGLNFLQIWETTPSQMLTGLTGMEGWQPNLDLLVKKIRGKDIILYIRNLPELFEVGRYIGNDISIAEYMREYIKRGEIIILSESTPEQIARIDALYPGYLTYFQFIHITPPDNDKLIKITQKKAEYLSMQKKITFSRDAIEEAVRLYKKFNPYSGYPGKVIHFLENLILEIPKGMQIEKENIIEKFCEDTGLPKFMVDPDTPLDLKETDNFFKSRLFGQEEAVETVVDLLASIKSGLTRGGKPIASLLFVGPTGVGKTEMAKLIAQFMFGSRERLIRFDMSEFSDAESVLRLIGDGFSTSGFLTTAVRKEPFSVVLFDELEKAHYSFFDLLLQILGEGRLTDSQGYVTDFCSTIVVMTSNLGGKDFMRPTIGFMDDSKTRKATKKLFLREVQKFFRPELFNRLDQIIIFLSLKKETAKLIAKRELQKLKEREGFASRSLLVSISDEVYDLLAEKGYHPQYGARQMQRVIQEEIAVPLSKSIARYPKEQNLKVEISPSGQKLSFKVYRIPPPYEERDKELMSFFGYTPRQMLEHVEDLHRRLRKLNEGHSIFWIVNKIELLKRNIWKMTRKKKKKKSYDTNLREFEVELEKLEKLLKNWRDLIDQVENIENNFALAILLNKDINPELYDLFENTKEQFSSIKLKLFELTHPQYNTATLAIYGPRERLESILKVYTKIAELKKFSYQCYIVWKENKDYKKRKVIPESLWKLKSIIGVEVELKGLGVFLYFKEEEGLHRWVSRGGTKLLYRVIVKNVPHEGFITPENIERMPSVREEKIRRIVAYRLIEDRIYKLKETGKNLELPLMKYLDEKFDKEVEESL